MEDLAAHPTVKPLRLVADALKDVTAPGEIVLDSFAGSGTTDTRGRAGRAPARAVEIDPKYADIAIRRWQSVPGGTLFIWIPGSRSLSCSDPARNTRTARRLSQSPYARRGRAFIHDLSIGLGHLGCCGSGLFEEHFGAPSDGKEKPIFEGIAERTLREPLAANEHGEHFSELIGRRG